MNQLLSNNLLKFRQIIISLISISCLTLSSCQLVSENKNFSSEQQPENEQIETRLTFKNVTLEQANSKGQVIWKLKADTITYTQDQQKAELNKIVGNLFQDGKLILRVQADQGSVIKNGEDVLLRNNILVTDQRNGTTFQGDEAEWKPKQDLLIVRRNLKANHPSLEVSAKEGKYNSRKEELELSGQIVATGKDPKLQMKTEQVTWLIPKKKILSNTKIQLDRYQDKAITDRLIAEKAEILLKEKTVMLKQNIELKSLDPPIQAATTTALWNYKNRTIKFDNPVTILHLKEKTNLTGNKGQIYLSEKITHLWGGVIGISPSNQAKLTANEIRWQMSTQIMEAQGNVVYQQPDPPLNLMGPKAVGRLSDNSIVVTSNPSERVMTKIIPE